MGWVKEVGLAMMKVGHTHDDIDALYRRVAEYWSRKGKVLTPYDFFKHLRESVENTLVHSLVEYVHDYAGFFKNSIAFWYKPDAPHKHLHPSEKDADGNLKTVAINGKEQEGPQGLPTPAPFATCVTDANKPRFDHVAARANVINIMDALTARFTPADRDVLAKLLLKLSSKIGNRARQSPPSFQQQHSALFNSSPM
eukprot:3963591-Pleurochrysis_carterae.AAC.2